MTARKEWPRRSEVEWCLEVRTLTAAENMTYSPLNTVNDTGVAPAEETGRGKASTLDTVMRALSTGGMSLILEKDD